MSVQIIEDSRGNATGVYIPIKEWKELKKQHKDLEALEQIQHDNTAVKDNLNAGLKEVALFKKGKLKTTPAKDFLNELPIF